MNLVSPLVEYDKILKRYTVEFIEDCQNETAVFDNANDAEKFVKELRAMGYEDMEIY
jgi:hypothetical protein